MAATAFHWTDIIIPADGGIAYAAAPGLQPQHLPLLDARLRGGDDGTAYEGLTCGGSAAVAAREARP